MSVPGILGPDFRILWLGSRRTPWIGCFANDLQKRKQICCGSLCNPVSLLSLFLEVSLQHCNDLPAWITKNNNKWKMNCAVAVHMDVSLTRMPGENSTIVIYEFPDQTTISRQPDTILHATQPSKCEENNNLYPNMAPVWRFVPD